MSQARDRWIKRNGYSRGPWQNYYTPERAIRRNDVINGLNMIREDIVAGNYSLARHVLRHIHDYQKRYDAVMSLEQSIIAYNL